MKIVHISSEVSPYSKTGGLGDVAGALPKAQAALGHEVTTITPLYGTVSLRDYTVTRRGTVEVRLPWRRYELEVFLVREGGVELAFLDAPELFDRPHLYGPPGGDYADNHIRFGVFSLAALELVRRHRMAPDIIHCHDWQTALVPYLVKARMGEVFPTVFTIHNLGYQGLFPAEARASLGIPMEDFTPEGLEFYGKLNLMKAGIVYSHAVTTVSERYAEEIRTQAFGHGLDGLLRSSRHKLRGILNGADYEVWDPATDPHLPASYDRADTRGKEQSTSQLLAAFGLPPRGDAPVLGLVSRLVSQKGIDLLIEALDELLDDDVRVVVLGTGEDALEEALVAKAAEHPSRLAVQIAYDERLAHLVEAGSHLFLMPSRYEPCGLNQIYSLKYGTIPLVRATGGLDDTVVDVQREPTKGTGFKFDDYTAEALVETVRAATSLFADRPRWRALVERAMAADFSWNKSAKGYIQLYHDVHGAW